MTVPDELMRAERAHVYEVTNDQETCQHVVFFWPNENVDISNELSAFVVVDTHKGETTAEMFAVDALAMADTQAAFDRGHGSRSRDLEDLKNDHQGAQDVDPDELVDLVNQLSVEKLPHPSPLAAAQRKAPHLFKARPGTIQQ